MGGVTDDFNKGIITATVQETFEPLHTGHSLIFTIAPNGHVWGKKLDEKSGKTDVEVEIFAPAPGGYFLRQVGKNAITSILEVSAIESLRPTVEQKKKIITILSQKERINYLLGTLMLRSHDIYLVGGYYYRYSDGESFGRPLINPEELPYTIKVIDCSYGSEPRKSALGYWDLVYFNSQFVFQLNPRQTLRSEAGGPLDTPGEVLDFSKTRFNIHFINEVEEYTRVEFFAVQAENKKFDLRNWHMSKKFSRPALTKTFQPELKIMYGEYDFFDYFEIDDAILLLEEERLSETESKFCWTIGVAQNKLARNLTRLKSNNPELLSVKD